MPSPGTLDIKIGRVTAVDMLHDPRQISQRRFKQKVIMVGHKAVGMNHRVVSLGCCLKVFEKLFSVADALKTAFRSFPRAVT